MSRLLCSAGHRLGGAVGRSHSWPPDPVSVLRGLRETGIVTTPYYLHHYADRAEIGWGAQAHLACLDGPGPGNGDWVAALKALAEQAADGDNRAFGYLGFEAWDRRRGLAPDAESSFPLVQFFIPAHRLRFQAERIDYRGPSPEVLEQVSRTPIAVPRTLLPSGRPDAELSEQAFLAAVADAIPALVDGLNKVVLSRWLRFDAETDLLDLFTAYCLRQHYADAVLMDFGGVGAAVASPELLVKSAGGLITTNPLAGTTGRGRTAAEDRQRANALLRDRKELAEHTVALRQMMNELTPHCVPGSVVVSRLLDVMLQRQVMHLSSVLTGRLAAGGHCIDAMLSLFPSAMVSGVPKAEAIAMIRRLEPSPRGLFGGTLGWLSGQDCRFALTIRGVYRYASRLFVQAGAGIMPESSPARENDEVWLKMAAMLDVLVGTGDGPWRRAV